MRKDEEKGEPTRQHVNDWLLCFSVWLLILRCKLEFCWSSKFVFSKMTSYLIKIKQNCYMKHPLLQQVLINSFRLAGAFIHALVLRDMICIFRNFILVCLFVSASLKSSSHQNGDSDLADQNYREKRHYPRVSVPDRSRWPCCPRWAPINICLSDFCFQEQDLSPIYAPRDRDSDRSRERVVRSSHSTDRARSLEVLEREPRDKQYPFIAEVSAGSKQISVIWR